MRDADRTGFTVGLRALAAVFRTEVNEAMIAGYWMGLEDIELSALGVAMRRAIRECRFMPVPAELRELAGKGKDRRNYHEPWRDLEAEERKRIRDSWIGPERQLRASETRPVEIGQLVQALVERPGSIAAAARARMNDPAAFGGEENAEAKR